MAPKRSRGAAKSAAPMNPVEFLQKVAGSLDLIARKDGAAIANLKAAVKTFYDQAKSYESVAERKAKQSAALPELVVDGFLPEQIWAAMELHNGPLLKRLQPRVKRIAEEGKALAEEADKEGGSDEEDDDSELASEDAGSVEGSEAEAEIEDDGESGSEGEEDEDLDEEQGDDDEEGLESGSETEEPKRRSSNRDTSAVDDEFFRLEDMERFAEQFEEKDMKRADGADDKPDFDLGMDPDEMSDGDDDEEDDEEDDRDVMYADFFGPAPGRRPSRASNDRPAEPSAPEKPSKKEKTVHFDDEEEDDDYYNDREGEVLERRSREEPELPDDMDETVEAHREIEKTFARGSRNLLNDDEDDEVGSDGEPANLSTFEKQQRKIKEQIQQLEDDAMAEKYWALKGEVKSQDRPVNSLLEEALEVDVAAKPTPVITEESTRTLEDLIIQRIKDNMFDDVERRVDELALLQARGAFDPNRDFELSDEKSKQSLGEVYESEYLKQVTGNRQTEKDSKLQKQHVEIEGLMKQLFSDLDALGNWHYVPKAPKVELEVQAQTLPAIEMEEVVPLAVSDAQLAAPEEIYDKPRNERGLKDSSELTSEEKKRARAARKREKKADHKASEDFRKLKEKATGGKGRKLAAGEEKKAALKQLSKNRNVTIISDGTMGLGDKKGDKKRKANVVEKGGSAKRQKVALADANNLKL